MAENGLQSMERVSSKLRRREVARATLAVPPRQAREITLSSSNGQSGSGDCCRRAWHPGNDDARSDYRQDCLTRPRHPSAVRPRPIRRAVLGSGMTSQVKPSSTRATPSNSRRWIATGDSSLYVVKVIWTRDSLSIPTRFVTERPRTFGRPK